MYLANIILQNWKLLYCIPNYVSTDNAPPVCQQIFHHVMSFGRVTMLWNKAYHLQTNGQVERNNCTFVARLRLCNFEVQKDWEARLQPILYANNKHTHRATEMTPFNVILPWKPPSAETLDRLAGSTDNRKRNMAPKQMLL